MPQSFVESESDLTRVMNEIKDKHRLDISVVGTGSSALPGPDGARFAYPARLEEALKQRLPGNDIKVTAHVQPKADHRGDGCRDWRRSWPTTSRRW